MKNEPQYQQVYPEPKCWFLNTISYQEESRLLGGMADSKTKAGKILSAQISRGRETKKQEEEKKE